MDISKEEFRNKVIAVITEVQETYWNLVASIEELKIKRQSLDLARNLVDQNKLLVEAGRLPSVATLQAQVGVASRKEVVLLAKNGVKNAEDQLKNLVNIPVGSINTRGLFKQYAYGEVDGYK